MTDQRTARPLWRTISRENIELEGAVERRESREKVSACAADRWKRRGKLYLFTDADLSAPIEEADKLLAALKDHDVAIGSRAMDRHLIETHQSAFREFAGILFNKIVRMILRLPFVDTQCGFKAFRRERCRIIFEQQTIERFGFDPELLYLARHHGLSTAEVPVQVGAFARRQK